MTWQDRLLECEITSPSGAVFTLDFEDMSNSVDARTTSFNFPDAPGTLVQQSGITGRTFPLRLFLWGEDYDLQADAFFNALGEQGRFTFQHPQYGTFQTVPVGSITRNDALKTAANQAVFEITLIETITEVYPTSALDAQSQALQTLDLYNQAQAAFFEDKTDLDTAIERVSLENAHLDFLDTVSEALEPVAAAVDSVADTFAAVQDSITNSIDVLVGEPVTLAAQTLRLIQEPGNILAGTRARLTAYTNLIESLASGTLETTTDGRNANTFLSNDVFATGALSAQCLTLLNNDYTTRSETVDAANGLLDNLDTLNTWRENNFTSLGLVDTGGSYQQILALVGQTVGFLVAQSFGLAQERRIILDRNRNIVELCAELYNEIDDRLEFFIVSNDFTGSEILEVERGREVVYYV